LQFTVEKAHGEVTKTANDHRSSSILLSSSQAADEHTGFWHAIVACSYLELLLHDFRNVDELSDTALDMVSRTQEI
jgi:hypothetical protein